eukprot:Pgem_evm1s2290
MVWCGQSMYNMITTSSPPSPPISTPDIVQNHWNPDGTKGNDDKEALACGYMYNACGSRPFYAHKDNLKDPLSG